MLALQNCKKFCFTTHNILEIFKELIDDMINNKTKLKIICNTFLFINLLQIMIKLIIIRIITLNIILPKMSSHNKLILYQKNLS